MFHAAIVLRRLGPRPPILFLAACLVWATPAGAGAGVVEELSRQIEAEPEKSEHWVERGRALLETYRLGEARSDFEQALRLAPVDVGALEGRASCHHLAGRYEEALDDLDAAAAGEGLSEDGARLRAALEGPFRARWGAAADYLEGRAEGSRYSISTDLGVSAAAMDDLAARLRKSPGLPLGHSEGWEGVRATMERVHEAYLRVFPWLEEAVDAEPTVHQVFVFERYGEFADFSRKVSMEGFEPEGVAGFFSPSLKILVLYNLEDGERRGLLWEEAIDTLYHEGFHQFLDRHLRRAPPWYSEGFAEYFGPTVVDDHGKTRVGLVPPGSEDYMTRLDTIQAALRGDYRRGPETLERFMVLGPDGFGDGDLANLHYAEAWSLVHFLMSTAEGREDLEDYFRRLAGGQRNGRAVREVFGDREALRDLEGRWKAYTLSLENGR
ncbi:MAG: DUF1570 domain-containing protein [Planctomycetes bacterium]|nr:DUF1570 domain-containing protein [Planctomycetota bacterium]